MEVGALVGLILGIVIATAVMAALIWIVGKLGLGLEVDGFGPAFVTALLVAVVGGLVNWVWTGLLGFGTGSGIWSGIFHIVVAAGVLLFVGDRVRGIQVKGFGGAIVACLAIGAVAWLIEWGITVFA